MKKFKKKYSTDYLLPKNSFIVGMGSVLNLRGSYFDYNYSNSEAEADFKAMSSDWSNVGDDLRFAKRKFERIYKDSLCLDE